jgi:hypothetical protein
MTFYRPFCITVISKGCGKKWFLSGLRSYCSTYMDPPNLRSVRKTQYLKNNTDEIKYEFTNLGTSITIKIASMKKLMKVLTEECLLPLGPESGVLLFTNQKYKD